jgi:hypothetical protein
MELGRNHQLAIVVWLRQLRIGSDQAVFENSTGIKNSDASEFVVFYKIQKNSTEMHLMSEMNMIFFKHKNRLNLPNYRPN